MASANGIHGLRQFSIITPTVIVNDEEATTGNTTKANHNNPIIESYILVKTKNQEK